MTLLKTTVILLALFAITSLATSVPDIVSPTLSMVLFDLAPVTVFNVSNASDSAFLNGFSSGAYYSAGATSDTVYAWLFDYDFDSSQFTKIVRRTLNTTVMSGTLATDSTEPFVKTADVTITQNIPSSDWFGAIDGPGYVAFATISDDTNSCQQVSLCIIAGNSSTVNSIILTTNTDTSTHYDIGGLFWEDGYFYIVYISSNSSVSTYYLQGVAANNTKTLYSAPMSVATTGPYDSDYPPYAGASKMSNSTYIYLVYKDPTPQTTSQANITKATGTVGSTTTLMTDSATVEYYPGGIISSNITSGVIIISEDTSFEGGSFTFLAYYNGSTTNPVKLPLTNPLGFAPWFAKGIPYGDGFMITANLNGFGWDTTIETTTAFHANGTVSMSQEIIGIMNGPFNYFVDTNGAVWLGSTSLDWQNGVTVAGSVGLLTNPYSSGKVLSSFFAILSLLIASLFVF